MNTAIPITVILTLNSHIQYNDLLCSFKFFLKDFSDVRFPKNVCSTIYNVTSHRYALLHQVKFKDRIHYITMKQNVCSFSKQAR